MPVLEFYHICPYSIVVYVYVALWCIIYCVKCLILHYVYMVCMCNVLMSCVFVVCLCAVSVCCTYVCCVCKCGACVLACVLYVVNMFMCVLPVVLGITFRVLHMLTSDLPLSYILNPYHRI